MKQTRVQSVCSSPTGPRPESSANYINDAGRLNFERFDNLYELDDIKPSFTTLILADERLGTTQLLGQIDLRDLRVVPCIDECSA